MFMSELNAELFRGRANTEITLPLPSCFRRFLAEYVFSINKS